MAPFARPRSGIGAAVLGLLVLSSAGCGGDPGGTSPQAAAGPAGAAAPVQLREQPGTATAATRSANAIASLVELAAATSVAGVADPAQAAVQGAPEVAAPESDARKRKADRYCKSMRQHAFQQAAARHRSNSRLETRLGNCWDWSEEE